MEECVEENQQQSDHHAFGTVRDEERLARFVWRSDHLAADGELAPAAFPVQDLLEQNRGGLTKGVRAIRKGGARLLCVVDDGLPDFQAHAVTRLADHQYMSRSSVRRVRKQLMHTFAFQPSNH